MLGKKEHSSLQLAYFSLYSENDFTLDLSKTPEAKREERKEQVRDSIFKNLGIDPTDSSQTKELRYFLAEYTSKVSIGKFLFGNDFKLNGNRKGIDEEEVFKQFNNLNNKYGYFHTSSKDSNEFKEYLAFYKACLYKAKVIEHNDIGEEEYTRAYKMQVLFPKGKNGSQFTEIDEFIGCHASHLPNPIHDIFYNELPKARTFNLHKWKKLLYRHGIDIMVQLENALKVEEILGRVPENTEELVSALSRMSYKRYAENEELARLCKYYNVPEYVFDRCLNLIKDGTIKLKDKDSIPSVVVDLEKEVDGAKGYYIVKLPAGDLRGLILGFITNCCQSVGRAGEKFVIKGMNEKNTGFYLLLKGKIKDKKVDWEKYNWIELENNFSIEGQGNIWRSKNRGMTIGCWENKSPIGHDELAYRALPVLGRRIKEKDESIERFTLGVGGRTPDKFQKTYSEGGYDQPLDNFDDYDARMQVILDEHPRLTEIKRELAKRTGEEHQANIISIKHGEIVLSLGEKILTKLVKHGEYWALTNLIVLPLSNDSSEYKFSTLSLLEMKKKKLEKYNILFSWDARAAYETGRVSIQDLKDLDEEKIKLLISNEVRNVYETGKVSIDDLKFLGLKKIILLISDEARAVYGTGKVSIQDLKDLDEEKIKLLSLYAAKIAYEKDWLNINELSQDNIIEIKIKILKAIAKHICNDKGNLDYILSIPGNRIELLISSKAITAYATGKVSIQDLKDLDEEKIELLITKDAKLLYATGKVSIQDLKGFDVEKIKLFISWEAREAYSSGKLSFQDLKEFDVEKITFLISWEGETIFQKWNNSTIPMKFKFIRAQDVLLVTSLSEEIGKNLFQSGAKNVRKDDVKRIEASLTEVIDSIRSSNPNFEIGKLHAGKLTRWICSKAQGTGLSELYYRCSSYTLAGYITGGMHIPEKSLTDAFQNQVKSWIEKVVMQPKLVLQSEISR